MNYLMPWIIYIAIWLVVGTVIVLKDASMWWFILPLLISIKTIKDNSHE